MGEHAARQSEVARILVVEDSEELRLLMELALREEGFVVDGVSCAEDGARLLEICTYDLVLCDYSLPGHSGAWLLSHVLPRNGREGTRAVMITGDPDAPGIPGDLKVLRKPLDFDRLLLQVRSIVEGPAQRAADARLESSSRSCGEAFRSSHPQSSAIPS